jgi:hypothetical protein
MAGEPGVDNQTKSETGVKVVEMIFGNTTVVGIIGVVVLAAGGMAAMPSFTKEIITAAIPVVAALAGGPVLNKLTK